MRKKAQAAMEFLMTYGWAILVVLAAIGALAYLGILNPANWVQGRCDLQSDVRCSGDVVAQATDADGSTDIIFEVLTSDTITISDASFQSDDGNCGGISGTNNIILGADPDAATPTTFGSGVAGAGTEYDGGQAYTLSINCPTGTQDPISGDISITYRKGTIAVDRTLTGRLVNIGAD